MTLRSYKSLCHFAVSQKRLGRWHCVADVVLRSKILIQTLLSVIFVAAGGTTRVWRNTSVAISIRVQYCLIWIRMPLGFARSAACICAEMMTAQSICALFAGNPRLALATRWEQT